MDQDRARSLLIAEQDEVRSLLKGTEAAGQADRVAEVESEAEDEEDAALALTEEGEDDAIAESLRDRLDAIDRALHRLDDGTVVHGEVRNGDFPIWLHQVTAESAMDSPREAAASHGGLSVRIPDVDAHYARVKAAGAHVESEPTDRPYGLREYGVRDLDNHRWWFSSPPA